MKPVPWAWTAVQARFGPIDARGLGPLGLYLLHWTYLTLFLALAAVLALWLLERRGLTVRTIWPYLRALLVGPERPVTDVTRFRQRCRP
jgi:hypothetical protein